MQDKKKIVLDICPPNDSQCVSIVERLTAFVDGELTCEEETTLFNELKMAPHYINLLDEAQILRDTIREKCERKKMNPEICEKLKSNITQFLNQVST